MLKLYKLTRRNGLIMKLRFLQISDIHFQYKSYSTDKLRDKLIEIIKELNTQLDFNAILITGDIAHQGDKCTQQTKDFLKDILSSSNLDTKDVHIIPGNHDVKRNEIRQLVLDGIFKKENPSDHLDTIEPGTYDLLMNGQSDFLDFCGEFKGSDYSKDQIHMVYEGNFYNIIKINTCLTSYKDQQEGSLLVGKSKLYEVLNKYKTSLLDSSKINIAIGHHTLDCIDKLERQIIFNNFDDFDIDIYLAGHVHQPNYFFTTNSSEIAFKELTSGSLFKDDYATPGFVVLDFDLDNLSAEAVYYTWNAEHDYWTFNNQLGRRAPNGKLKFELERLKKKTPIQQLDIYNLDLTGEESSDINEDEFKEFIITFHNTIDKRELEIIDLDKRIELEEKFEKMKCSETFASKFEKDSRYFSNIYEIMDSTAYVSSDKKELVADVIIEHYLDLHTEFENGDKIFVSILRSITDSYKYKFNYSELKLKKYIRILISWSIYECNIFNDIKGAVLN